MMRWLVFATALLCTAMQAGGEGAATSLGEGLQAYRRGDYERALEIFSRGLAVSGAERAPELRLNAALSALRLLRSRDAEEWVAPLVDDPRWGADAAFLLGMAARQHGERAVIAAKLPDAEPMAWVMASRAMQRSELQFKEAVRRRSGWPAAVRNLERAVRRRAEVEAERAAAAPKEAKQEEAPEPQPQVQPPVQDAPPEVVVPDVAASRLSAAELAKLQRRVLEQQREKVRGRQRRSRQVRSTQGRDW